MWESLIKIEKEKEVLPLQVLKINNIKGKLIPEVKVQEQKNPNINAYLLNKTELVRYSDYLKVQKWQLP